MDVDSSSSFFEALLLPYLVALKAINPSHPKKAIRMHAPKLKVGHRSKYPQNTLLFFRFIRKCAQYKDNSVLLLRDRKNTARCTLQLMLKGVMEMSEKSAIVFVGSKTPMDYVLAVITRLSASNAKEVVLKARGQAITTAVDVAEITRSRFLKDLKVSRISIGTEEMPAREGENRTRMVSTIEITLTQE
jgi:DNA-binding protein